VPLATNPLRPLIDFFEAILVFFHGQGLGWGMAIVALTVVVRAALMPLTIKQFKSMQNLAKVQPEIKKLQEKYKGDKERMQQELMKFYRENKVNPFSSCLPILAQLPVFLSLFYMLREDLRYDICPDVNPPGTPNPQPCGADHGESQFLFITDLTARAGGTELLALIVLYVASQLLSTILMSTATDRNQKMIMYALPFVFIAFIWQFPAGLLVYWITTNLWTIVQQAIVRRRIGPIRPPTDDGEAPPTALIDRLTGAAKKHAPEPALAGAGGGAEKPEPPPRKRRSAPPPAPPRKKKKRSGRRR
jgi:YidC/Oxa1 family membrane protein insertase